MQIDPHDHTSMEVKGHGVTVGLKDGGELDEHRLNRVARDDVGSRPGDRPDV
ncbi:hypothetical protein [Roseateles noduli]|jgi:hypothetical protein|uniref:hypothetical protein n=1 Tax=Roseateles noduli TaxID=2052484 RepID=UPI003D64B076